MPSKISKENRTPRDYISYSQLDLFERSPEEYRQRYFYGKTFSNGATEYGRRVHEALEVGCDDSGGEDEDGEFDHFRTFLPKFDHSEYEIKTEWDGIPLYGKLDLYSEGKIGEIKTGVDTNGGRWSVAKTNKSLQLTFYAALVWLSKQALPEAITLYWLPVVEKDGKRACTGEIRIFQTMRTMSDIIRLKGRIVKAWEGIQKMAEEEYSILK